MWAIISGIVGALLVHVAIWAVRRHREARAERRRLELFAMLYNITVVKGESNAELRVRMNDVIRGVHRTCDGKPGLPAWLTKMQENGESWLKKHGGRS